MSKHESIKNFVGKIVIFTNSYGYTGIGKVTWYNKAEDYVNVNYLVSESGVHSCCYVDPETKAKLANELEYEGKKISYEF
jgi:hypothetical protein